MTTLRETVSTTTERRTAAEDRSSAASPCVVAGREPGTRMFLISLAAVVIVTAVVVAGTWAALAGALAAGAAAALVDLRTRRIPNPLVALAAFAATAGVIEATIRSERAAIVAAILGVLGLAGPLLVVHLVAPSAIGFGDVKLAGALGAAIGLLDPRLGLLALCVATGTTGVAGLVARRRTLPLGPGLVLGVVAAAAFGTRVWS